MESMSDTQVDLVGVSGFRFPTFGILRVFPLFIEGKQFIIDLLVADIAEDCILGQDFLEAHEFTLDFGSRIGCSK